MRGMIRPFIIQYGLNINIIKRISHPHFRK